MTRRWIGAVCMMCWYGRHLGFFNLCSGGVTGSADDKKMDWSRVHNVLVLWALRLFESVFRWCNRKCR